jgi:hypothetical protein
MKILNKGIGGGGSGGGTPGGSTTQVQYNNAGAFGGISTFTYDGTTLTTAGQFINSYNATASSPAKAFTGTWFITGGTATTTKPQVLIEPTGATSTAWSTSGTGLGVNAASGFANAGRLLDLQVNGTTRFHVSGAGWIQSTDSIYGLTVLANSSGTPVVIASTSQLFLNSSISLSNNNPANGPDVFLTRDAANTLAQRNGTAAQTTNLYNTYTDSSNYERLATTWSSNVCFTRPQNAGTGSARLYVPVTGATTVAGLPSASTAGAGARSFVTDATVTVFLTTVAGGGANKVPVVSDGTNWLIG